MESGQITFVHFLLLFTLRKKSPNNLSNLIMHYQRKDNNIRLYMHWKQKLIQMKYLYFERDVSHCYHMLKTNIGESLQIIFLFTLINIKSNEKRKVLSLSFSRDLCGQAI